MAKVTEEYCHFGFIIINIVLFSTFMVGERHHAARSLWFAPVMTFQTSAILRYNECCILHIIYCLQNLLVVMVPIVSTSISRIESFYFLISPKYDAVWGWLYIFRFECVLLMNNLTLNFPF